MAGEPAARARILLVDPAPGALAAEEIQRFADGGYQVVANASRLSAEIDQFELQRKGVALVEIDVYDGGALYRYLTTDGIGFDVLKFRFNMPVDREVIEWAAADSRPHRLRVIGQAGSGLNHIDRRAAAELGVAVTNTPGSNASAVAEFVIALTLALTRRIVVHNEGMQRGKWMKSPAEPLARELAELTLGIVGMGAIGSELARKATRMELRSQAVKWRSFGSSQAEELGIGFCESLDDLLATSDIVSLNLPLTDGTRGLIGERELKMMKQNSLLVNTARGGLVDEDALASALVDPSFGIFGAAIDTYRYEGANYRTPLLGVPGVILTPHFGGSTVLSQRRAMGGLADNIDALLSSQTQA
jgi:D-3-phosphoglycerate dehydrogenase